MDLYIDRTDLSKALAKIQDIVERRTTNPILAHVLLHARDGKLTLTATDTEIASIVEVTANIEKPGELTVDASKLFQISRSLPQPTVRITASANNRLTITSGNSSFKLPGSLASEYPALPAFDAKGTISIAERELRRLVAQTSFAVAGDDSRYGLNGVFIESREHEGGHRVRFVGTDGHRLAAAETSTESAVVLSDNKLLPRKALNVMKKLLERSDDIVEFSFGDGAMRVVKPGQVLWFRLIDGRFPNYEKVMPQVDAGHKITIDIKSLSDSLKRVSILIQERTKAVAFSFDGDTLNINANNIDHGEISDNIQIEMVGDPIKSGFNTRYLSEVLSAVEGETIKLSLANPLAPCLIEVDGRDDAFFIVMPMRLD